MPYPNDFLDFRCDAAFAKHGNQGLMSPHSLKFEKKICINFYLFSEVHNKPDGILMFTSNLKLTTQNDLDIKSSKNVYLKSAL